MFSPRLLLPRSLPRTSLLSRTLSTLPPPPPPSAAARPSRLRSFALTSASLVIAGYAMVASQNQATLMLEEAQGITREPRSTQPSFPAQPPTTSSSNSFSFIGGEPEIESTSVQSSFSSSQPKEMTQEEIDDLDSGLEDGEGGASASSSSSGANSAAYNEETGEINWDCPCLGGMAHGPCGEQFRASFTCFVRSEEEPKGIECVESFKAMQGCFREHPEIYGGDDFDDEEEDPEADAAFEKAHPPPTGLGNYEAGSGDDADLIAQAEQALGENKVLEGLQEAKEGGEPLFEEKIGSRTETDSQI